MRPWSEVAAIPKAALREQGKSAVTHGNLDAADRQRDPYRGRAEAPRLNHPQRDTGRIPIPLSHIHLHSTLNFQHSTDYFL